MRTASLARQAAGIMALASMGLFLPGAWCDKESEVSQPGEPPGMIVVLTPEVRANPDSGSGLSVAAWQHVVALRQGGADSQPRATVLVSCQASAASSSEQQLVDACVRQILGQLSSMSKGAAGDSGGHPIQTLAGPEVSLQVLSGPSVKPPAPAAAGASEKKGQNETPGPRVMQTAVEASGDWTVEFDPNGGFAVAAPKAAPKQRVRLTARNLFEFLDQPAVSKDSSTEAQAGDQDTRLRLPVAFDRVELSGSGSSGTQPVRLRFFPPALPEGLLNDKSDVLCDTGAVSLPVPRGWELLYFEERLWLAESSAAQSPPTLWPWLPKASSQSPEAAAGAKGALLLGARTRAGRAAVVGCVSPSQPPDGFLPAFTAVLEGLRLSSGASAAKGPEPKASGPVISISPGPAEFALPDHTLLGDSPEWLAALMAEQQAVEAMNAGILAGADVTDLETQAAVARLQEAIQRLNEEIVALYPDGGEPAGWAQERLDELMQ